MMRNREAIELIRERLTNLEHEHSQATERAEQALRKVEALRVRMGDLRSALAVLGEGEDEPEAGEVAP